MPRSHVGVQLARRSLAAGRFGEALRAALGDALLDSADDCVVLAEAQWRVGHAAAAETLLERCADSGSPSLDAKIAELRGHLAWEAGRLKDAVRYFDHCIERGSEDHDLSQVCRGQLALFGVLLDQQGSQACETVAADVRRNVIRSGDPLLFASLHRQFAAFEARAGNSSRAFRHLEAGFKSVASSPNPWLQGSLWIVRSSLEGLNGAVSAALRSARKARDLARVSGHEKTR